MPPTTLWPETETAEAYQSLPAGNGSVGDALPEPGGVSLETGLAIGALGLVLLGGVLGLMVWCGRRYPSKIAAFMDHLCCLRCGITESHVLDFTDVLSRLQKRREVVEVYIQGLQPPPSPAPSLRSLRPLVRQKRSASPEPLYIDPGDPFSPPNDEIERALELIHSVLPDGSPPPLPPPPRRLPALAYTPPTPTPSDEVVYSLAGGVRVPSSLRGKPKKSASNV